MYKTRQAFTLIELLVVIAIIAILAAILFPVFAKVREKARQTSCTSNEKQLGLSLLQYVQDYDEFYPSGMTQTTHAGMGWAAQVYPYVKSTGVFKCPDDSTSGNVSVTPPTYPISYGLNDTLSLPGMSDTQLTSDTKTVMLFEVVGSTAAITAPWNGTTGDNTSPTGDGGTEGYAGLGRYDTGVPSGALVSDIGTANGDFQALTGRHTDAAMYLMCDGHAKYIRRENISSGAENGTDGDCGTFPTFGTLGSAASADCDKTGLVATYSVR
jgi:prepilin-type N-terminal cleavage/methylation domain-containing protein/prepilin-type processing-associated H-X9-DG protein